MRARLARARVAGGTVQHQPPAHGTAPRPPPGLGVGVGLGVCLFVGCGMVGGVSDGAGKGAGKDGPLWLCFIWRRRLGSGA